MTHPACRPHFHFGLAPFVLLTGALGACGGEDHGDTGNPSGTGAVAGDGDGDGDGVSGGDGGGDGGSAPGTGGEGGDGDGDVSSGGSSIVTPADCRKEGDDRTTIVFVNHCSNALNFAGSDIEGGIVPSDSFVCRDVGTATEELSAKRYWGWLGEDPGAERHTLAEFTFNTDFNDFDWYNISHVDAHNLTMQIIPLDRTDCDTLTCAESLIEGCPEVGLLEDSQGAVISCVSPDRDNATSPVALHFEACDDGYAWSGDDQQGDDPSPVRACAGEDWQIVFCP